MVEAGVWLSRRPHEMEFRYGRVGMRYGWMPVQTYSRPSRATREFS